MVELSGRLNQVMRAQPLAQWPPLYLLLLWNPESMSSPFVFFVCLFFGFFVRVTQHVES